VLPTALDRVELQKMSCSFCSAVEFVDVDYLNFRPIPASPEGEPTHPTKAVDPDPDWRENV
jgi:hypothetical protein